MEEKQKFLDEWMKKVTSERLSSRLKGCEAKIQSYDKDRVLFSLIVTESMGNVRGALHGAAAMLLLDNFSSCAHGNTFPFNLKYCFSENRS